MLETKVSILHTIFFYLNTILLCYYYHACGDFLRVHKKIDDLTTLEVRKFRFRCTAVTWFFRNLALYTVCHYFTKLPVLP